MYFLNWSFAFHIKRYRAGSIKLTGNINRKVQKHYLFQYYTQFHRPLNLIFIR